MPVRSEPQFAGCPPTRRPHEVFTADAASRPWLTGITEHLTGEGKLYLCAIKDVHSGRIVGYSIDHRMKAPGRKPGPIPAAPTHSGAPPA